jgi:hypothetical protein
MLDWLTWPAWPFTSPSLDGFAIDEQGEPLLKRKRGNMLVLLRHEIFCLVGGNLRAQQGHRGRARASATISR